MRNFIMGRSWWPTWPCAIGRHSQNSAFQPRIGSTAGGAAPLQVIRERYGRIAFGHSELSGRQSWGRAAQESRRALKQVLEVIA
jgi:hypothetical protein